MENIERIYHGDSLLALIIPSNYQAEGIRFFTPENFSQQLAYMKRPKGYAIEPHIHNEVRREVFFTQEVLFVRVGRLKVHFFDKDQIFLKSRILENGDTILLASGGHGFEMLEDSEIIEVKQGPYTGEQDKIRFNVELSIKNGS